MLCIFFLDFRSKLIYTPKEDIFPIVKLPSASRETEESNSSSQLAFSALWIFISTSNERRRWILLKRPLRRALHIFSYIFPCQYWLRSAVAATELFAQPALLGKQINFVNVLNISRAKKINSKRYYAPKTAARWNIEIEFEPFCIGMTTFVGIYTIFVSTFYLASLMILKSLRFFPRTSIYRFLNYAPARHVLSARFPFANEVGMY